MLRGLAKLLPLIIHEIADLIMEKLRVNREKKQKLKTDPNEKN